MNNPTSIKEAVEQLQAAVSLAMPGMRVSVSINMIAENKTVIKPILVPENVKEDLNPIKPEEEVPTLEKLRLLLNTYALKAGKDAAIALVRENTTDGSKNPGAIPQEKYINIIQAMGGLELDPPATAGQDAA